MPMKKYMLLLSCSLFAAGTAQALTAADQLKAVKEIFIADFHKMDDNKDGVLSKEEYLSHQFENFRANIIEADGFEPLAPAAKKTAKAAAAAPEKGKTAPKNELKSLSDVNNALQEMADYDLEADMADDLALEEDPAAEPKKLTKEDVMPVVNVESAEKAPEKAAEPELDLSVSEDDSLKGLLAELSVTPEEKAAQQAAAEAEAKTAADAETAAKNAAEEAAARDKQIGAMLDTIKKTLPKKVDEITTWTDIEYKDKAIAYIYKADIDTAAFSASEKKALQASIKDEACTKAYAEMCPKIKPLFIKDGINVKIRYIDQAGQEISFCEFNNETCE